MAFLVYFYRTTSQQPVSRASKLNVRKFLSLDDSHHLKLSAMHLWVTVMICPWMLVSLEKSGEVSIVFGGDVSFDGPVRFNARRGRCPYERNFDKIRDEFDSADFVMVNLESAVSKNRTNHELDESKAIHILADVDSLKSLRYAGVDVVTIANNHLMDCCESAINQTIKSLKENEILYAGVTYGRTLYASQIPVILKANGVRIGILAYCLNEEGCESERKKVNVGPAILKMGQVRSDVKELRKHVDIVAVYAHWDVEFASVPYPEVTIHTAIELSKMGVDILVGAHPHVKQGHMYIGKMMVAYSLGNLMFPMTFSNARVFYVSENPKEATPDKETRWFDLERRFGNPTKRAELVKVVVNKSGIVREKTKFLPIDIEVNSEHCLQPRRSPGSAWRSICGWLDRDCYGVFSENDDIAEFIGMKKLRPGEPRRYS